MRAYFCSPLFYGLLTVFLFLSGYFFFTDLAFFDLINFKGAEDPVQGLWQRYFHDLRFLLILLTPLTTMRLLAEEKRQGTFELITTYPVRDGALLAGKYLAALTVLAILLAGTLVNLFLWIWLAGFHDLPALAAGYLGLLLLGAAIAACGLFVSSLTDNQAVAGMATLGVFILLWFLTWNEMAAGPAVMEVLTRLSLFDRLEGFFQGVIRLKDVVYLAAFSLFFLFMAWQILNARTWRGGR
jgi:ABC-2 type transport system permease protein